MTKQQFKYNIGNLAKTIKKYIEQGRNISYSAVFTIDGKKQKLIDLAEFKTFRLLNRFLEDKTPSRIRVEIYDRNDTKNMIDFRDFDFDVPVVEPVVERPAFMGFGEAEISQIVDQRMAERQRAQEHEDLKEHVKELMDENQELLDKIEELESANEKLEIDIEKKQSIRYYAGMLGDILESFGIKRDKIKKPLAELMGVEEEKEEPKQVTGQQSDNSGIVEEELSPEEKKRAEIINLITQYLKTLPNATLATVFKIFSAIEQNPFTGEEILDYLNNRNPKNDE
jgi:hypothetical protein